MKPLDQIDRQLLARLQDNARMPLVALAKAVGLSRSAVQERLARLERSGVIAGYGVRLGAAGQPRLQAWLLIRHSEGFSCADVMPELIALPGVTLCHSVAGDTDLMVLTATDTASELARLREHIAALKSVDDVTTIPVLEVTLDRR